MSDSLSGPKAVVPGQRVRLASETVRVSPPAAEGAASEPRIQLIREEGVVRAIDVICRCGEKIRIICEY